jgi:branched-subunit amino acid ABC-type transport system permease component
MDISVQQVLNGLVLGSVYAIIALGYTMVYGILGIINFAHSDVLMVGAGRALGHQRVAEPLPQSWQCADSVHRAGDCRCRARRRRLHD